MHMANRTHDRCASIWCRYGRHKCTRLWSGVCTQNDAVILKTLLALPAVSFVKRPRMAVLRKKECSGRRNCPRLWRGACTLPHGYETYCVLQAQGRCIWRIVLMTAAPPSGAARGYRMYLQNCNAILKTLLALPAVSFVKRPRMAVLRKKERSGSSGSSESSGSTKKTKQEQIVSAYTAGLKKSPLK